MAQNKKNNAVAILGIAGLVLGFFFLISADGLFGGASWAYWASGITFAVFIGLIVLQFAKSKDRKQMP